MQIREVIDILQADVICADDTDREVYSVCGSDMMSDVLAYVKEQGMLLTGLLNTQAVRTADMLDMHCVCFVRGKVPGEEIIALAKKRGIVLLCTKYTMYNACGRLFNAGLGERVITDESNCEAI